MNQKMNPSSRPEPGPSAPISIYPAAGVRPSPAAASWWSQEPRILVPRGRPPFGERPRPAALVNETVAIRNSHLAAPGDGRTPTESSRPGFSRRHFLQAAGGAGLGLGMAPYILAAETGRKFRTALIGSGWWGKNLLKEALASGRVKVTALCDADATVVEVAADQISDLSGDQPKTYRDFRELLEKDKPEIVIIASPDHWHALQTIAAVKAGAHVFVEKPTGHTVNESRAMLAAAKASGRAVQVGLHRRIGPHHVSGMKFLKSGAVGNVGMVRLFATSGGGRENPSPNSAPPDGMDW